MNSKLDRWKRRLEERSNEHSEADACWRREFTVLCALCDLEGTWHDNDELRQRAFAIPDARARRGLIAHYRNRLAISREQFALLEEQAKYGLKVAKHSADSWWLLPSVAIVGLCFAVGGLLRQSGSMAVAAAIGIAAAGVLYGLNYRERRLLSRRNHVRFAREVLAGAQTLAEEARRTPQVFSESEAETGIPDAYRSMLQPYRV